MKHVSEENGKEPTQSESDLAGYLEQLQYDLEANLNIEIEKNDAYRQYRDNKISKEKLLTLWPLQHGDA